AHKRLPDLSIEQIFVSGEDSGGSRFFTVRTSNKDAKEGLSYISTKPQGKLKQGNKADPKIVMDKAGDKGGGETDTITQQQGRGGGSAAAPQVQRLTAAAREAQGLRRPGFSIAPPAGGGKESEENPGHYSELRLALTDPLERSQLEAVLKAVQQQFKDMPQPE